MSDSKEPNKCTALQVLKQEVATFKVPTSSAPAPRKKQKVLDEDDYVHKLEKIIQRDFFPDLTKLQIQAAYLEALETNDVVKLRQIYEKYSLGANKIRESQLGHASPATFETPTRDNPGDFSDTASVCSATSNSSKKSKYPEDKLSLDEFLNTHTSEDNESFEEMMDEAKKKHRLKYGWLYDAEDKSKVNQETNLALPSIERQAIEDKRPAQVDTWNYTANNSIMYVPEGAPLTIAEKVKLALDKDHIVHGNTHFKENPFDEERNREMLQKAAQQKTQATHVDVDGKEIKPNAPPTMNGFDFIKTPSPAPGVSDTPVMTWGEIEGTPFRLDGSDTPLPSSMVGAGSFQLQPISNRDRIGLKLAEKVGKGYRDRRARTKGSATPISTPYSGSSTPSRSAGTLSQKIALMSPAARQLATSKLGIRLSTDSALQASYTPRHHSRAGTSTPTPSRTPSTPSGRTPRASPAVHSSRGANLTDNLLQLPKRTKAADFF
nr:EOG090X07SU [Macrothrix elegans]